MSDPKSGKDFKRWQMAAILFVGILVVSGGLLFIFGGSDDGEGSSTTKETASPQIQQPSDQPTDDSPSSTPADEGASDGGGDDDDEGLNESENTEGQKEAEAFMKIINKGGKGDDLKKKLKDNASSAFLASLHGVPDKAIPTAGEEVAMADDADDGSKTAIIKDKDGDDLYSISLNSYKVNDKDKYLVDALDLLDDGSHAALDKDGKPVRIDVMPLFQDSKDSMYKTAVDVMRNYVEYDADESNAERKSRVQEKLSGKKDTPAFRLSDLGTEVKIRMYSPQNVRFLNASSGDKADDKKISVAMTVKSANLTAGKDVIDTFEGVVDYTWNKDKKMWEPSAIRVV